MTYCQTQKTERGFTLVELAIVLIIVGLLIGGILKGQELIQNARVTATVSQMKAFEAATNTFRDSFNSLPGDLVNAGARLPGCAGNCVSTAATLGNGAIDQNPGANATVALSEGVAVFSQLAAADLISGANATPISAGAAPFIGDEFPETELGGSAFVMGFASSAAASTPTSILLAAGLQNGTYIGITPNPAAAMPAVASGGAMQPMDVAKIDNKIDDGLPNQGTVRVAGVTTAGACATTQTNVGVYGNSSTNDCGVYIRIQ